MGKPVPEVDAAIDALVFTFRRGRELGYAAAKRDAAKIAWELGQSKSRSTRVVAELLAEKIKAMKEADRG